MISRTTQGHSSSSHEFTNRGSGPGFAQRVKEAQSIDSTVGRAKALEALAKETPTWQDLFTVIRASDALPPALLQDVDTALLGALAQRQEAPIPTDLGDHDLQALQQFCQRVSQLKTKDQQARLHQLLEPPIRQRIEALMNQCYGSNHLPIERYLERLAPLGSQIPSLARYIADIQDILGYQRSEQASAIAAPNTSAVAVTLHTDICHLIALRLLRRATVAETREGFNDSINDLMNFGLVCKLFHDGAQRCAIPQALALRLSFAGLPQWLKAFQAAIDAAPHTTEPPLDEKRWKLLNTAQQSVVRGYLKFAGGTDRATNSAIERRQDIAHPTGITHPLGAALIAYAHRVHLFPISRQISQADATADKHLFTWKHLEKCLLLKGRPMVGALVELLIALAADLRHNKGEPWDTSPDVTSADLAWRANLDVSTNHLTTAQPRFIGSLLTSGTNAIAAILLAAHDPDGPPAIEQAQINETLDFLVHYTALGYAIPASAQEALAQVIVHVGMHAQQADKLRTCLEQARKALPEWT